MIITLASGFVWDAERAAEKPALPLPPMRMSQDEGSDIVRELMQSV